MSLNDDDVEVKLYPSTHTWEKNTDHALTTQASQADHRFTLRIEKELIFKGGAINLILGPTASGKTSVLMALLGQCMLSSHEHLP